MVTDVYEPSGKVGVDVLNTKYVVGNMGLVRFKEFARMLVNRLALLALLVKVGLDALNLLLANLVNAIM